MIGPGGMSSPYSVTNGSGSNGSIVSPSESQVGVNIQAAPIEADGRSHTAEVRACFASLKIRAG